MQTQDGIYIDVAEKIPIYRQLVPLYQSLMSVPVLCCFDHNIQCCFNFREMLFESGFFAKSLHYFCFFITAK